MSDSPDIFGSEEPEGDTPPPTAAELEAAGQNALFGEPAAAPPVEAAPAAPPVQANQPYRVLARKYRPQTFGQLIGQDAMVQTLANAIRRDRLAHAFLMTGVRGVGKTSTARLIAKALNCIGPDGNGGPTIDPCGVCEPCVAIAEGRHIDVIEMDAASHTGVDDVREIIEAVRYAAVSARYKIYIIDEVHMLSRNAFNALLKTLEEPPAHVKFLFATTEVDKLPVTVLSRCQRFDLRRITAPMLKDHFAKVCEAEGVTAEDEALEMVASAAEGSVRDGLSILDQAIAHADMASEGEGTHVTADQVRDMLGLADKGVQRRLLAAMLSGDGPELLDVLGRQYALGVEPVAVMRGQMDLIHRIALCQLGKGEADGPSAEEREAIADWAGKLGAGQVHRLWQLLLKGHDEVRTAPEPLAAAQMALLRAMHAADMPDPGALVRKLDEIAARPPAPAGEAAPVQSDAPAAQITAPAPKWIDLVAQVEAAGFLRVGQIMADWVRVIDLKHGQLRYANAPGFDEDIGADLRDALYRTTGERWTVERGGADEHAPPTIAEERKAMAEAEADIVRNSPMVKAAVEAFPDAKLLEHGRDGEMRRA
ncbi:DNA polymerase III subunit gamma/tau [Croceicoccus naphthovorans]|uniref:DNA polymerase III subunit gamma/tau n=1 Tax=Croceicoccus naphthovorans TaxID=1348774 RepID=A0A0G3XJ40_9SPHN|nr:DNA polymerase III subunit gamma/tau [Croceicoccus naphthovorans]AKM10626.1 DNA polymerase III subunit gamma/tau [Croceicoccus naphthovorans]MBB3988853.1 DNA polymerase-3 subunit gamma/tau [Croceicoccus naphthovorans]